MNSNIVLGTTRVSSSLTAQARDAELNTLRSKPGGAAAPELEDYLKRKNLPYWSIELPFYGPTEVVPAQWAFGKRKFSVIPGVQFRDGATNRLPPSPEDVAKAVPLGVPSYCFCVLTAAPHSGLAGYFRQSGRSANPMFSPTPFGQTNLAKALPCEGTLSWRLYFVTGTRLRNSSKKFITITTSRSWFGASRLRAGAITTTRLASGEKPASRPPSFSVHTRGFSATKVSPFAV